jgi:hypothetical protein
MVPKKGKTWDLVDFTSKILYNIGIIWSARAKIVHSVHIKQNAADFSMRLSHRDLPRRHADTGGSDFREILMFEKYRPFGQGKTPSRTIPVISQIRK